MQMTNIKSAISSSDQWDSGQSLLCASYNRTRKWETLLAEYGFPSQIEEGDLTGKLVCQQVGAIRFIEAEYDPVDLATTPETCEKSGEIRLILLRSGEVELVREHDSIEFTAGDFFLMNSKISGRLRIKQRTHLLAMNWPGEELVPCDVWRKKENMLAFLKPNGLARLFSNYFIDVFEQLPDLSVSEVAALIQPTISLIDCAVGCQLDTPQLSRAQRAFSDAKQFTLENIRNPELSPTTVAQYLGISTRYLHALFKPEGVSVSDWIKNARIEGVKAEIARHIRQEVNMTSLAFNWGFNDLSTFYRHFKKSTGLPPGEYVKLLQS
jgi:AraC-like DNA-binding protein